MHEERRLTCAITVVVGQPDPAASIGVNFKTGVFKTAVAPTYLNGNAHRVLHNSNATNVTRRPPPTPQDQFERTSSKRFPKRTHRENSEMRTTNVAGVDAKPPSLPRCSRHTSRSRQLWYPPGERMLDPDRLLIFSGRPSRRGHKKKKKTIIYRSIEFKINKNHIQWNLDK